MWTNADHNIYPAAKPLWITCRRQRGTIVQIARKSPMQITPRQRRAMDHKRVQQTPKQMPASRRGYNKQTTLTILQLLLESTTTTKHEKCQYIPLVQSGETPGNVIS